MSKNWVDRYNADIRLHLAAHMQILKSGTPYTFERVDYKRSSHISPKWDYALKVLTEGECSIDPLSLRGSVVSEKTIWEFTDTDHDSAEAVVLRISPVSCRCGKISGATGEWSGSLADLMMSIVSTKRETQITL